VAKGCANDVKTLCKQRCGLYKTIQQEVVIVDSPSVTSYATRIVYPAADDKSSDRSRYASVYTLIISSSIMSLTVFLAATNENPLPFSSVLRPV